jgi:hypothetical protein
MIKPPTTPARPGEAAREMRKRASPEETPRDGHLNPKERRRRLPRMRANTYGGSASWRSYSAAPPPMHDSGRRAAQLHLPEERKHEGGQERWKDWKSEEAV